MRSPSSEELKDKKSLREINEFFSHELDFIEKLHSNGNVNNVEVIERFNAAILDYLHHKASIGDDALELKNADKAQALSQRIFNEELSWRVEKARDKRRAGLFIIGLKIYGSSIKQAEIFVSEWTGLSTSHVRQGYESIENRQIWFSKSSSTFVRSNLPDLANFFIQYKEKSLPEMPLNSGKKAVRAFHSFKDGVLKAMEAYPGRPYVHPPFAAFPDWEKSALRKEELTTQK